MSNENLTNPTTEEMAREVYEFFTGKCAHKGIEPMIGGVAKCPTCGASGQWEVNTAPLATSLDAWRPIWEAMTDEQNWKYHASLLDVAPLRYNWKRTPMHHLEAAYKVVKGE